MKKYYLALVLLSVLVAAVFFVRRFVVGGRLRTTPPELLPDSSYPAPETDIAPDSPLDRPPDTVTPSDRGDVELLDLLNGLDDDGTDSDLSVLESEIQNP